MPDNTILHWTEDEDLLAEYVLGRLSAEDRKELETHLRACPQCKEVVQKERALVSGIRQFGRQELKARLRQQIETEPGVIHSLVTWQRVASAAAVLIIIGGLGIYNRWFNLTERESLSAPEQIEEANKSPNGGKVNADDFRGNGKSTIVQENRAESSGDHIALQNPETPRTQVPPSGIPDFKAQSKSNVGFKGGQISAAPSSGAGGVTMKDVLRNEQDRGMLAEPKATQFWTEGMILTETHQAATRFNSLDKKSAPNRPLTESGQSKETNRAQSSLKGVVQQGQIVLHQRTIQSLPFARQKLQQKHQQTIQAYFQQSTVGTTVTLYVDSLLNEAELRHARIERIAPDSLVIRLQSRTIGFKVPPDFLETQIEFQKNKER
jgi:hypothetical protein